MGRRISFYIRKKTSHWDGATRPFVTWASELHRAGEDISVIADSCGERLLAHLDAEGIPHERIGKDAGRQSPERIPDVIVTDDRMGQLEAALRLAKRAGAKTAIYGQVLFGMHSIAEAFDRSTSRPVASCAYSLTRCVPFSLLKSGYRKLLGKGDVAANSHLMSALLNIFYGVEVSSVVYPPVDRRVFRSCGKPKRQALLYMGSYGGDTPSALLSDICREIEGRGLEVVAFGNHLAARRLRRECPKVRFLPWMEDAGLAEAYSQSMFTVCPQRFEAFGYVPAESICCGTPVACFDFTGMAEIIRGSGLGLTAHSNRALVEAAGRLADGEARGQGRGDFPFCSRESAARLLEWASGI